MLATLCVCVRLHLPPSHSLPPSYVCHWLASGVDPQLERNEVCTWLALVVHSTAIVKMMFVVTAQAVHAGRAGEIYIVYFLYQYLECSYLDIDTITIYRSALVTTTSNQFNSRLIFKMC